MLCSAGSGLQWFSRSLPSWLGTSCNWSWHSTQRAPWLMPLTSQLVPPAPVVHCQLAHCTTNLLLRIGMTPRQGLLSAPLTWVLNCHFLVGWKSFIISSRVQHHTTDTPATPTTQKSSNCSCQNDFNEKFKKFVTPAAMTSSSANTRWFLYFALML